MNSPRDMRRTIAIDLDGVLASYKGWKESGLYIIGDPLPGALEMVKTLHEKYDILIHTSRCCPSGNPGHSPAELRRLVEAWLVKHGFPFEDIWMGRGKPIVSCFIDDNAIRCCPQKDPRAFEKVLSKVAESYPA